MIDWQKLYWQADGWGSNLAFYRDELKFLQNLLDCYFEDMVQCQNLDEIREEIMRFQDLKYTCNQLILCVRKHRQNLALTMDQDCDDQRVFLYREHLRLQERLKEFLLQLKITKDEILMITKLFLENHKSKESYTY